MYRITEQYIEQAAEFILRSDYNAGYTQSRIKTGEKRSQKRPKAMEVLTETLSAVEN